MTKRRILVNPDGEVAKKLEIGREKTRKAKRKYGVTMATLRKRWPQYLF